MIYFDPVYNLLVSGVSHGTHPTHDVRKNIFFKKSFFFYYFDELHPSDTVQIRCLNFHTTSRRCSVRANANGLR